ncbi:MAG TPA: alpha/beta hydrolase [Gemmatimonadales bacterium]
MTDSAVDATLHPEGSFVAPDGVNLYYQCWVPANRRARAVLVNLHGLGDHSGLYPSLAAHFPPRGVALYAYDMRGNGRSPGQRAYVRAWQQYLDDLHAFLLRVREWEPNLPVFVLGNSLGGLVVLEYAIDHPGELNGVIAAAPPLGQLGVPRPLMALGRVMSRIWPRFSLEVGMDLSGLARDPKVIDSVVADPLFHRRGTARLSTEVTAAIARVQARAADLSVPLLLLHGSADRMVPPDGTRAFFSRLALPDRKFCEYEGAYHGLFADLNHAQVLGDVERWIGAHMATHRG